VKKKVKKVSKSKIDEQCLTLWSLCVRAKNKTCRICGSDYRLQAHHIRSRTNQATRFDLENGLSLCSKCHILQKFSPERFQDKIIEAIGEKEYKRLKRKSLTVMQYKRNFQDLLEIKHYLKDALKTIQEDYGR
jgi:hypothetical protein